MTTTSAPEGEVRPLAFSLLRGAPIRRKLSVASVLASVVSIGASGVRGFHFAPGPPCSTPFQDVTPAFVTE